VTIAVWALYLLAAIQIISAILTIATMGATLDAAREAVEGTSDGDTILTTIQISSYVGLAFGVAFAIGFAVLSVFVGRGSQPARIVAWVVLGLMLCCNGFGLLGAAAGGVLSGAGGSGDGEIDQAEVTRSIEQAIPGWVTPVNYVLLFLGILASAAGIILLALPAANEFFRRREPVWEPPVPGAYYPTPGAPGEPSQSAPSGGPSQSTPSGDPVLPSEAPPAVDVTKPADGKPDGTASGEPAPDPSDDRNDRPGPSGTGNPPPAL
jgi:hypothetical protein